MTIHNDRIYFGCYFSSASSFSSSIFAVFDYATEDGDEDDYPQKIMSSCLVALVKLLQRCMPGVNDAGSAGSSPQINGNPVPHLPRVPDATTATNQF